MQNKKYARIVTEQLYMLSESWDGSCPQPDIAITLLGITQICHWPLTHDLMYPLTWKKDQQLLR